VTIEDKIKSVHLTKKSRMIAQFIIDNREKVAFMSATHIANELGISDVTVIRFARSLGYEGYSDLQRSMQEAIQKSIETPYPYAESPGEKLKKVMKDDKEDLIQLVVNNSVENIESCLKKNSSDVFNQAAKTIAESKKKIIIGFWGSSVVAQYLYVKLGYMCDGVSGITSPSPEYMSEILTLTRKDCVIIVSSGRYPKATIVAAQWAKNKKAKVILITDKEVSPLNVYADYMIVAPNAGISFSNPIAPMLVCEIFINIITKLYWNQREYYHNDLQLLLEQMDFYEDKTSSVKPNC